MHNGSVSRIAKNWCCPETLFRITYKEAKENNDNDATRHVPKQFYEFNNILEMG